MQGGGRLCTEGVGRYKGVLVWGGRNEGVVWGGSNRYEA